MSILDLVCSVDDFWQQFALCWRQEMLITGPRRRQRATTLHPSELMTIVIPFHQSHYWTFWAYSIEHIQAHWPAEFPHLVSSARFVALLPTILVPLTAYLHTQLRTCIGISFVDSTDLAVCHNARIQQHWVFAGRARRGKTSVG